LSVRSLRVGENCSTDENSSSPHQTHVAALPPQRAHMFPASRHGRHQGENSIR